MKNKVRIIFLSLLALTIPFTISSSANASLPPMSEDMEPLGDSHSNASISSGLTAEVNEAKRNERGNFISITWSLKNTSDKRVVITWMAGRTYKYEGPYFSGVTIFMPEKETRFHPIMDGIGNCLCSGNNSPDFKERIEPGEKVSYWSLYSIPNEKESLTVEIPGFEPIEDIPIS